MSNTRRLSFTGRGSHLRLVRDGQSIQRPRPRNAKALALEAWETNEFRITINRKED